VSITKRQMVTELNRELAQRDRVYPRLIDQGKLTQAQAVLQTERLRAARDLTKELNDQEEAQVSPSLFQEGESA